MGVALLPLLSAAGARANPGGQAIDPPQGPLVFSRSLTRDLRGDAQLTVTRRFSVRFLPSPDGYRVEGEQLSAIVEAPESLARFAELEEARVETGVFPLMLDPFGHILGGGASRRPSEEVDQALEVVNERLRTSRYDPQDHDRIRALVEAIHQAGGSLTSDLPHDLFAPTETERRQREEIALPWGETGVVTASFAAQRDPATGLMRRARREVVTEMPGSRRSAVESWQLSAE